MTHDPEPARPADAEDLVQLRDAAARWLLDRGIEQWGPGELDVAGVEAQVRAGEWHVVRTGHGIVAALRLLWDDPFVWGDQPPVAGYVHGLVIDRVHGRGLGAALLDWAGEQVRRQGRTVLRLDCQEHNEQLRRYYRRRGFTEVGRSEDATGTFRPVVRFERPADPGSGRGGAAAAAGRR